MKKTTKKKILDDSDNEESVIEIKEAKAVVQKMIGESAKVVTPSDCVISKMFTYKEADVLVILDENKNAWYKGRDIATILEYTKTANAISYHVSKEYKKSLADIGFHNLGPIKTDPQTIFVDNTGLFQLISKSKKPEAVKLWQFITREVLPTLFTTGTYTLPAKESDIIRLNKSFYDDNMLSDYENNPVVYFAYIDEYNDKHKMKWGFSKNFVRRDLDEHRKDFKIFNVMGIWKSLAYQTVEDKKIKGKTITTTKKEIITLDEVNNLDYCLNMIDNLVKK